MVKAYNALFALAYSAEAQQSNPERDMEMVERLADFLLAIRRSTGNEETGLSNWDMLRWLIKDLDQALSTTP